MDNIRAERNWINISTHTVCIIYLILFLRVQVHVCIIVICRYTHVRMYALHTHPECIKWRLLKYKLLKLYTFLFTYFYITWYAWKQMYFWKQPIPINALPYFRATYGLRYIAGNQNLHPTSDVPYDPRYHQWTIHSHQMAIPYGSAPYGHQMSHLVGNIEHESHCHWQRWIILWMRTQVVSYWSPMKRTCIQPNVSYSTWSYTLQVATASSSSHR